MKKIFILTLLATFFAKSSSAQFDLEGLSLGASGGYNHYLGNFGRGSLAFDLRGHYYMSERSALNIGIGLQSPIKEIYEERAFHKNLANPSTVPINIEYRVSLYRILFEYNFYLLGDMDQDFGLFALAGFGLTIGQLRVRNITDFDRSTYNSPTQDSDETLSGPTINLGIGGSYNFTSKFAAFAEGRICLPANSHDNGMPIYNDIPFNFGFGIGIRFNPFYQESEEE